MAKITKLEDVEGGKVRSERKGGDSAKNSGVCEERKKVGEVEEVNERELILETTVINDDL